MSFEKRFKIRPEVESGKNKIRNDIYNTQVTSWIVVKELYTCSQDGRKHPVMKNVRSSETDEIEQNGSCKVEKHSH